MSHFSVEEGGSYLIKRTHEANNMKRLTILLMTVLLTTLGAQAQDDERQQTISGRVIDSELREPMVQASVQLFRQRDSTFVAGSSAPSPHRPA